MLIYLVPVVLVSITFHELSHAYCSYRLGDPTAKNMGRLTLNPLKHLDILGTIMILLSGFGWAKPVPINPVYYKDRKKGTMLVGIAGPLSNILLAFIFSFPMAYIGFQYGNIPFEAFFSVQQFYFINSFFPRAVIFNLSRFFYMINVNLAVFNILPVPPLDGSKILSGILPSDKYFKLLQYEQYIALIFLMVIFIFPNILYKVMFPFIWVLETAIRSMVVPVLKLMA
ncbi:MAG: site-2 protease family protein [Clostridiaceae bacterium]|nr:site-2 protease family protein [Clostridiaceae bacterium]